LDDSFIFQTLGALVLIFGASTYGYKTITASAFGALNLGFAYYSFLKKG